MSPWEIHLMQYHPWNILADLESNKAFSLTSGFQKTQKIKKCKERKQSDKSYW